MTILGTLACSLGRHDLAPARQLTRDTTEWRCTRTGCAAAYVGVAEPEIPAVMRGRYRFDHGATFGDGGIGSTLLAKGRDQGVDQTLRLPFRDPTPLEAAVAAIRLRLGLAESFDARTVRLAYLCDWRLALTAKRPITGAEWRLVAAGPESEPLRDALRSLSDLDDVAQGLAAAARPLDPAEAAAVDHVAAQALPLRGPELSRLVLSTRPAFRNFGRWNESPVLDLVGEALCQTLGDQPPREEKAATAA